MDHYCEIDVKTVLTVPLKIFGITVGTKTVTKTKKQGMYFDLYAWFLLWQTYNWDFESLGKKNVDELSSAMLYTGAVSWCRAQGIQVDFTRGQVESWIDEIPTGKMKEIGRVLVESMHVMEQIKAGAGGGEKKNK